MSPSLQQRIDCDFNPPPISGDLYGGIYQGGCTFPQLSESGTWHVTHIQLTDLISNDRNYSEADLIAMGFPTELEVISEPTIEAILTFFNEAVTAGTLVGHGPGKSAQNRLNAFRNMLEMAADLIDSGDIEEACTQLNACYKKCDGMHPPPDFVAGEAAPELRAMIENLMAHLGCE
jgi:hypothetical protein